MLNDTGITQVDAIEARRGAAVVLEVLRSEGVRYIFGNLARRSCRS